ncbi:S-layer homology domain-containing protein [Brevibacillus laterosporus]|uniref:S-layer homology domain-containing protein n=1 Tax=Brevibacillus laterosporus TaxID=1465 RepID=UPI000372825F|nr:S-layer homology domain-containing protein [Brevibacillus laterosporus]ATO48607.1 hypothetical protein BrL25_05440 [Brevibacillus laterosporus DSM 25]MED2002448.1 S-layer homology domain-containing protein [Brevibacillus laterosporus]
MKKRIVLAITLASSLLIGSTAASAQTSNFKDVSETQHSWAISSISFMTEKGVVTGYSDGTFKPDEKVTKAEFISMTHKLFDKYRSQELVVDKFIDVPKNYWAYTAIYDMAPMMDTGNFSYYTKEGKVFDPDKELTRMGVVNLLPEVYSPISLDEAYKRVSKMQDFKIVVSDNYDDNRYMYGVDMTNTVFPFVIDYLDNGTMKIFDDYTEVVAPKVASLQQHGIMTTYNGEFEAADQVTRAEAVTILHRLYNHLKDNGELSKYSSK